MGENDYLNIGFVITEPSIINFRASVAYGKKLSESMFYPAGSQSFSWNGRDLDGNVYLNNAALFVTDPATVPSNSVYIHRPSTLVITSPTTGIEIKANPFMVVHSFEQFSQFEFELSEDAVTTVTLLPEGIGDVNDPSAIVMANDAGVLYEGVTLAGATTHTVQWNGYADSETNEVQVANEGYFLFVIEAVSVATGRKTEHRGTLRLYR